MTLLILITCTISTFLTLILISTPLTLGIWAILLTLFFAGVLGLMLSRWGALILFLIYVGGLLVLIAYFVALSPNQKVTPSIPLITLLALLLRTTSWAFLWIAIVSNPKWNLVTSIPTSAFSLTDFTSSMSFLSFLGPSNLLTLPLLGLLLLLILIAAVKVSNRNEGALRPFKP